MICVFINMTGTPEGSTESGFMEKPGIEPSTPGLQGIALIGTRGLGLKYDPTDKENNSLYRFCGRVPRLYQYWPGGFVLLWFYVQELPKAQPAVVLVLKRLRRRGNGLKSHPTDWEKPGIEPATPGLQDIGLSPTPRLYRGGYIKNI